VWLNKISVPHSSPLATSMQVQGMQCALTFNSTMMALLPGEKPFTPLDDFREARVL